MKRGSWEIQINVWDDDRDDLIEPSEVDLEYIASCIIDGCTSGLL